MMAVATTAFADGWSVKVEPFNKAHYFKRDQPGVARAACNAVSVPCDQLLDAGGWARCSRCARIVEAK